MIENLWKKGSDDWEPFGKKGEQNDEQDQEPLEKKVCFSTSNNKSLEKRYCFCLKAAPSK